MPEKRTDGHRMYVHLDSEGRMIVRYWSKSFGLSIVTPGVGIALMRTSL